MGARQLRQTPWLVAWAASAAFRGAGGMGMWGRRRRGPCYSSSILEDLRVLGERSLPELGSPRPAPAVLGTEGVSNGTFLPPIPQKMQRAWAGPGFWVEEEKHKLFDGWKSLSGWSWHLPTWQQLKHRGTACASRLTAWEIWGERPRSPMILCHLCPPHCRKCTPRVQPVSWGAPAALCAPVWRGAALAGPTLLWGLRGG